MSQVNTGGRLMKLKTMSAILKPSQLVVERVEALQEMAKEDEEKGKLWATSNGSSRNDMLHILEILAFILLLLPRTFAAALVFLSRTFLYVAQAVFYSDLDMRDVQDPDALQTFLVTRRDISSLTHTLRIPANTLLLCLRYRCPRLTPTRDTSPHKADTLLLNLTIYVHPSPLTILIVPSGPLLDASITILTRYMLDFAPQVPSSHGHHLFVTSAQRLRSAVVVCPRRNSEYRMRPARNARVPSFLISNIFES
ncbi:hypothetical protein ARMGADRAFT_1086965 [Armillaria gallica]|uniref:Uncharacterized protein n=1 Tax=Armillaria gallica TaxID=47427 RepID=A0A2H3CS91_ARMGA|nr:hypothetical protein ARMGADRAFT_1086965 [Armillaria gallica]